MVVMGRVSAPFGVRGWIKVHCYTETVESLLEYPVWWLGRDDRWREVRVVESRTHGNAVAALLEGCADRDAAEALLGLDIAVPNDSMPEPDEGEYYWTDLMGLRVLTLGGEDLGVVSGLLQTGANDVLRVSAERERLIPFIDGVVVEVDLPGGVIRVDWGKDYL